MSKIFSYSILQHRYSSLIDEVINIGVLFSFPEDNIIKFQKGNISRVKCLYSEFDYLTISNIVDNIDKRVNYNYDIKNFLSSLFYDEDELNTILLRPNDSSIQFSKPKKISYPFDNVYKTIEEYSKLLLPNNSSDAYSHANENKHNENYILRKYISSVLNKNTRLEKMFHRNTEIVTKTFTLNFEYGWKNGKMNLVKAVSLDLQDPMRIQNKGMQYYGYLTKLKDYAEKNKLKYDIIVGKPQDENLLDAYVKAVENINSADSYKEIITEETLPEYSEKTYQGLTKELENSLS